MSKGSHFAIVIDSSRLNNRMLSSPRMTNTLADIKHKSSELVDRLFTSEGEAISSYTSYVVEVQTDAFDLGVRGSTRTRIFDCHHANEEHLRKNTVEELNFVLYHSETDDLVRSDTTALEAVSSSRTVSQEDVALMQYRCPSTNDTFPILSFHNVDSFDPILPETYSTYQSASDAAELSFLNRAGFCCSHNPTFDGADIGATIEYPETHQESTFGSSKSGFFDSYPASLTPVPFTLTRTRVFAR